MWNWIPRWHREQAAETLFWLGVIVWLSAVIISVALEAILGPPPPEKPPRVMESFDERSGERR